MQCNCLQGEPRWHDADPCKEIQAQTSQEFIASRHMAGDGDNRSNVGIGCAVFKLQEPVACNGPRGMARLAVLDNG